MADDRERGYGRRESWRERESSIFSDDDDRWGRGSGRWSGEQGRGRGGDDDRGFFERAGDEVRSWFGDDDAERRRERDLRREEASGAFGGRDDDDRGYSRGPSEGRSGGFRGGYGFSSQSGGQSDWERGGRERAGWGSGFDRDRPERSERGGFGGSQSYDRGMGSPQRSEQRSGAFAGGRSQWDDNYRRWRDQQIQQFDREYADYCRERQGQFEQEFDSWRSSRLTEGGTGSSAGTSIQTGGGSATGYSGDSTRSQGNVGGMTRSTGSEGAGTTSGGGGTGSAIGSSTGSTGAAQETGSRVGAGEAGGGGRGRGGRSRT